MHPPRSLQPGIALAAFRVAIGTLGLLAPRRTQQAALLPANGPPVVRIWTRFWATRSLALGLGYLTANPHTRPHLIRMGLLVDTSDTTFLLAMTIRRTTPRQALGWLAAITTLSTATDLLEIRQQRAPRALPPIM